MKPGKHSAKAYDVFEILAELDELCSNLRESSPVPLRGLASVKGEFLVFNVKTFLKLFFGSEGSQIIQNFLFRPLESSASDGVKHAS